jgi:hypothetical protein
LFTAQETGFFSRRELAVGILFTTNSQELRGGLVAAAPFRSLKPVSTMPSPRWMWPRQMWSSSRVAGTA